MGAPREGRGRGFGKSVDLLVLGLEIWVPVTIYCHHPF